MSSDSFIFKWALLSFILLATLPSPCLADVQEEFAYDYYPVATVQGSLSQALFSAFPFQTGTIKVHAYTSWHIDWTIDSVERDKNVCSISKYKTKLKATVTLPRLTSPQSAAVQKKFDDYLPKLQMHEEGHLTIARKAASAMDSYLSAVKEASCGAISSEANKGWNDILARANAEEKDYDLKTRHGRTQGAFLVE